MKSTQNHYVVLKKYIDKEDYGRINELKETCYLKDGVNLKLELEYRLNITRDYVDGLNEVNEFLYYADDMLAGYLGISCFGGNVAEITGAVHPDWRRRGIFKRLYELALDEARGRHFSRVLLLCDDNSSPAKEFIKYSGAAYSFSEYRMRRLAKDHLESNGDIALRRAVNADLKEIIKQDEVFFGVPDHNTPLPEEEEKNNRTTYIIELNGSAIGKIRVEREGSGAFICGFGILPEFRGKGYGREALKKTIEMINKNGVFDISLDVASENERALNLYKSCGFVKESVMNYYEVKAI